MNVFPDVPLTQVPQSSNTAQPGIELSEQSSGVKFPVQSNGQGSTPVVPPTHTPQPSTYASPKHTP